MNPVWWYSFLPLRRFLVYQTAAPKRVMTKKASTVPMAMTPVLPSPLLLGAEEEAAPGEDCVEDLLGLLPVPPACGLAGSTAVAGDGTGLWLAAGRGDGACGGVWAGGEAAGVGGRGVVLGGAAGVLLGVGAAGVVVGGGAGGGVLGGGAEGESLGGGGGGGGELVGGGAEGAGFGGGSGGGEAGSGVGGGGEAGGGEAAGSGGGAGGGEERGDEAAGAAASAGVTLMDLEEAGAGEDFEEGAGADAAIRGEEPPPLAGVSNSVSIYPSIHGGFVSWHGAPSPEEICNRSETKGRR